MIKKNKIMIIVLVFSYGNRVNILPHNQRKFQQSEYLREVIGMFLRSIIMK